MCSVSPIRRAAYVEQDGCINLMKGGIEAAHRVTTVSPSYAQRAGGPVVRPRSGFHHPRAELEAVRYFERHRHQKL